MKYFLCLSALIAGSCATSSLAQDQNAVRSLLAMSTEDWSVDVVAEDLDYPWEIEHRAGRLFLTEAGGNVVIIDNGKLQRYPLHTSDAITREGGGGLLGMALSPEFETNGLAYFYHTYSTDSGLTNKVIEARFDGQYWQESRVLLDGIPGHRLYNGGRVAIGPDYNLYVTTGWTENRQRPQDLNSLAGKILRMNLDGKVPADNPFPGSYVYSYGHRNPQGIAWNPEGSLFEIEHGQSARDEINIITPGANYGWPLIDGDDEREGLETAFLNSGSETWAPSGAAFAGAELVVATLGTRGLYVLDEQANALIPIFSNGERLRDVLSVGNEIYVITTNRSPRGEGPSDDHLLRLSPKR
jgi:glucose/arabinose dehydrogenase